MGTASAVLPAMEKYVMNMENDKSMKPQTNKFISKSQTRIAKKSLPDIYTFIDLQQPEDNNASNSPNKPIKSIKIKSGSKLPKNLVRELYRTVPD
jgi:hypothetical protein